jgi:hypothetical protein
MVYQSRGSVGIGVEDRQDVRVLQAGRETDLAKEAFRAESGGDLGVQHLERDLPRVFEVLRQIDGGHPSASELALDGVSIAQSVSQL